MYVLVHHRIHDPERFWATAEEPPEGLTLHQTLSARDGTRATCLWEAESVEAVSGYLDPLSEGLATNEYRAPRIGRAWSSRLASAAPRRPEL